MGNPYFMDESRRQLHEQIEEILRIRGPQDGLACDEDVVIFAVNQLHQRVLKSRSAELDRLLVWRKNLK